MKYPILQKVLAGSTEGPFNTEIDLEVYFHNTQGKYVYGFTWPDKVTLAWTYEMETRSWGVKGIYFSVKTQELDLVGQDPDDKDFEVTLDLTQALEKTEYQKTEGFVLCPSNISLKIKGDANATSTWKCTEYTVTWNA